MAFRKEPQRVSVGALKGGAKDLVLTIQITAEREPLSVRERNAILAAMRGVIDRAPGLVLGYHTKSKVASLAKTESKPAKAKSKNKTKTKTTKAVGKVDTNPLPTPPPV